MAELTKSNLFTPSRRIFLRGVVAGAVTAPGAVEKAQGQWNQFHAQTSPQTSGWQILPIGAGGFLTGLSIAEDGTVVVRTDTYGGYVWNPSALSPVGTTGTWQQVINSKSMPRNYYPHNGNGGGLWDIQVAYNNSNTMYMAYNDVTWAYPHKYTIYKSSNKGQTWTATSFTPINVYHYFGDSSAGAKNPLKAWGQRLVIDPTNPNIVYFGTGQNGLFVTTTGGASWTNVSTGGVPTATQYNASGLYPGYTLCIGVYNSVQYVVAFSFGNGIYLTSNGGGRWSQINNGIGAQSASSWTFDPNTGYFCCVDFPGNVWRYTASADTPAWTKIYSGGAAQDCACDPNTANHLIITNGRGQLAESINGTSFGSFTTLPAGNPSTTGDVAWMSLFNGCNAHRVAFYPPTAKTVYGASDRDFLTTHWTGTLSSSVNLGWQSQARGIEQLVGNCITVANSGVPLVGVWDSGVFRQPNLGVYPPAANSYPNAVSVQMCECIDYAYNNSNFIVTMIDGGGGIDTSGGGDDISAYSSNGGAVWTRFIAPPGSGRGGSIAASTSSNVIFAPGISAGGSGQPPHFTTNFGTNPTWTACTLPPDQPSWSKFLIQTIFGGRYVAADRVIGNTFYLAFPNGSSGFSVYGSTNSGATWTNIGRIGTGNILQGAWLKTTPGQAGDFWFQAPSGALYHYYSGTLTKITNIQFGSCVGFGANPGGGYPSVFFVGNMGTSYPGTYGIYRSDNAATGATPTWNLVTTWPLNSFDSIRDISGDPVIARQCYIAFTGMGFAYYNAA